ncbi:DUF4878 domain-containing protein [Olleya sp. HaHaR_3_96]|uniref:DUF4878 domain-containing protein n=1 Tax=Olleya sp. HaHaR_3_96 TaxID=2745560 RepID=UPI001C4F5839|nr:DUF4878 domain-containing protein [Olleya sp. HaHaR_3_96]QXP61608.1 DUF4878 domain-containing protein [Olleya sp. HaHaR_3_96]
MKTQILKTILVSCFFMLTACGGGGPEGATIKFLESMYSGDFATAKEYATTDTKSMLSMLESFGAKDQFAEKMGEADMDFEVVETKIDGDKAVCTVKMTSGKEEGDQNMPINLEKVDGKWLVSMDKESMNKEGMGNQSKETGNPDLESDDDMDSEDDMDSDDDMEEEIIEEETEFQE